MYCTPSVYFPLCVSSGFYPALTELKKRIHSSEDLLTFAGHGANLLCIVRNMGTVGSETKTKLCPEES